MKRSDHNRENILREKREKSNKKRKEKYFSGSRAHYPPEHPSSKLLEYKIKTCYSDTFYLLSKHFEDYSDGSKDLEVPEIFSFTDDYTNTYNFFRSVFTSIFSTKLDSARVKISFAKCKTAEIGPLLVLQVILKDHESFVQKYKSRIGEYPHVRWIEFFSSDSYEVNRIIFALGFIPAFKKKPESQLLSASSIGFVAGNKKQKHYSENSKGPVCKKVRSYINHCLSGVGFQLNEQGDSHIDGLISEILNNAEDHSLVDEWYVAGASYYEKENVDEHIIGEVNLVIMNLGYSIYEGFEDTKNDNFKIYDSMQKVYEEAIRSYGNKALTPFTKENLFTLYALQEGISRIKFEEPSRGNGTMNFINSFMNLGDYEDLNKGYKPHLNILSGRTLITCNNKYKPMLVPTSDGKSQKYRLTLNPENDLKKLPDRDNLKRLNNYFPGTVLETRFFLDKDHLMKKWHDGSSTRN